MSRIFKKSKHCRSFSAADTIKDDKQFIEACHNIAKSILGDNYNAEVTDKTAEGILKDHKDMAYDEKIGFYRNAIKGFSTDEKLYESHIVCTSENGEKTYEADMFGPGTKENLDEAFKELVTQIKLSNKHSQSSGIYHYKPIHVGYFKSSNEAWKAANRKISELEKENTKSFSTEMTEVTFKTTNPEQLTKIVNAIGKCGNGGHTFDISIDPDDKFASFEWDGDGNDRIEVDETKEFSPSEKAAVVLKNVDGTHEVISIQDDSDEKRINSYVKDEGAQVVKRCKSTEEADQYIEDHKFKRAYSVTFSEERKKVSAADLKKAQEEGVVQKKPNGKWGIISIDAEEWWNADYDTKESAENALKAYHANKGFSDRVNYYKITVDPGGIGPMTYFAKSHEDTYYVKGLALEKFHKDPNNEDFKLSVNKITSEEFENAKNKANVISFSDETPTPEQKGFSSLPVEDDPSIMHQKPNDLTERHGMPIYEVPQVTADWSLNKPFNISIEPWLVANVINDKADGLYMGQMLADTVEMGKDELKLDIKLGDSQPRNVFVLVKASKAIIFRLDQLCKSEQKTYAIGDAVEYSFDLMPTEPTFDMQHLIGSWMMASSICHLFHICDQNYAGHKALEDFYEDSPEKIDALAEHFLAENPKACFRVCVLPQGCPIKYLEDLVKFTKNFEQLANQIPSAYQSQIDDLVNLAMATLYKLKRLGEGRKLFV